MLLRLRHVKKDWLESCGIKTVDEIVMALLNSDIKCFGSPSLPPELARHTGALAGPLVLQVSRVRNLSAPSDHQDSSSAPRMLRIQLTDGHTKCFAIETVQHPNLRLGMPPGTKVGNCGKFSEI